MIFADRMGTEWELYSRALLGIISNRLDTLLFNINSTSTRVYRPKYRSKDDNKRPCREGVPLVQ